MSRFTITGVCVVTNPLASCRFISRNSAVNTNCPTTQACELRNAGYRFDQVNPVFRIIENIGALAAITRDAEKPSVEENRIGADIQRKGGVLRAACTYEGSAMLTKGLAKEQEPFAISALAAFAQVLTPTLNGQEEVCRGTSPKVSEMETELSP